MWAGERGAAYREGDGPWEPVIVERGLAERPRSRLLFGRSPRFPGPYQVSPPAGQPLAIVRRKRDGQRLFLVEGGFQAVPG